MVWNLFGNLMFVWVITSILFTVYTFPDLIYLTDLSGSEKSPRRVPKYLVPSSN